MSSADLAEYSALVATSIQSIDYLSARTALIDAEDSALLNGAESENDLVTTAFKNMNARISAHTLPSSTK
jgi:hypothetical protein